MRSQVLQAYREELREVRAEMEGLVNAKVAAEKKRLTAEMNRLRKDKDLEIAAVAKEKDLQISKEVSSLLNFRDLMRASPPLTPTLVPTSQRHKVAKVLTALQDAEQKKREVEAIRKGLKKGAKKEKVVAGGGKSVEGTSKAKRVMNRF